MAALAATRPAMTSPNTTNNPARVTSIVLNTEPKSNERYHSRDVQTFVNSANAMISTATMINVGRMAPRRRPGARTLLNRPSPRHPSPRRPSTFLDQPEGPPPPRTTRTSHARVCANAVASPGTRSVPPSSSSGWVRSRATPCWVPLRSTPTTTRISCAAGCAATAAAASASSSGRSTSAEAGRNVRTVATATPNTSSGHSMPSRSARRSPEGRKVSFSIAVRAPGAAPSAVVRRPSERARSGSAAARASVSTSANSRGGTSQPDSPAWCSSSTRAATSASRRSSGATVGIGGVADVGISASSARGDLVGQPRRAEPAHGPDGVAQGRDPDEPHRGVHARQVATVRCRHQERGGTSLLRPGDLLLDAADGADHAGGVDRPGAGDVLAGEELPGRRLVVDGQGEDQARARPADLLAEVVGDPWTVGVAGAQGDPDLDADAGRGGGSLDDHPRADLVAQHDELDPVVDLRLPDGRLHGVRGGGERPQDRDDQVARAELPLGRAPDGHRGDGRQQLDVHLLGAQ